jgi:Zn/Cd-binding protein ZinT
MLELLKQILEENKNLVNSVSQLVNSQLRIEKIQKAMAKDIKEIKDYQQKGLDVDVENYKIVNSVPTFCIPIC